MRVVAGHLRGRRIESPDSDATRPTTDKVREAVFNALGSLGVIDGARVVDLFAGTGAMGIEALSRGAQHCTFVEKDRKALTTLRRNIDALQLGESATVLAVDAQAVSRDVIECDVLIADPPYGFSQWAHLLAGVSASLVVLESDREIGAISGWETMREKKYGRTHVVFLRPDGGSRGTVESA